MHEDGGKIHELHLCLVIYCSTDHHPIFEPKLE